MKINKKFLMLILIHAVGMFGSVISIRVGTENIYSGILYIFSIIPLVICMIEDNKLFTPLTGAVIFDISFGIYNMHLVINEELMMFNSSMVLILCIIIWEFIAIISFGYQNKKEISTTIHVKEYSIKVLVSFMFVVAVLAMLLEWINAGGIPILRSDQETFRFTVRYNSLTHILAISNKIIVAIIGGLLVCKDKINIKKDFWLIALMIISELMMVGTAMRGEMLFGPAVVFIVFGIKKKIPKKYYVIAGIIAIIVIGLVPYIRMNKLYGVAYLKDLKKISAYKNIAIFTPLIQTFSSNFSILAKDFLIFPTIEPFGLGNYSILPAIPVVDLGKNLMNLQNSIFNKGFYGGLTATFLATWYADFGYIGMIIETIIMSIWINFVYKKYVTNQQFFTLLWFSYTFYSSLWLVYNNTFDIIYIIYCLVIWALSKLKIQ